MILVYVIENEVNVYQQETLLYLRRGQMVGKTPVCCAGGRGFEPDRTNTQGLKITEEDVLPL